MKYLIACFLLFSSSLSFADAWDNLTMEEAEAVVDELKKNPYIFDYCDCCDDETDYASSALFVKVISTEIVTCDWNKEFYAVEYMYELIAEVHYSKDALKASVAGYDDLDRGSLTLYMNYTRGYNPVTRMASSFFNMIPYEYYGENPRSCKPDFAYPTPKELAGVYKNKAYKKWWKKNVK